MKFDKTLALSVANVVITMTGAVIKIAMEKQKEEKMKGEIINQVCKEILKKDI